MTKKLLQFLFYAAQAGFMAWVANQVGANLVQAVSHDNMSFLSNAPNATEFYQMVGVACLSVIFMVVNAVCAMRVVIQSTSRTQPGY